jgi:hypothetical protein
MPVSIMDVPIRKSHHFQQISSERKISRKIVNKSIIVILISSLLAKSEGAKCFGVICDYPPTFSRCEIVPKNDPWIPQPTGAKAECCALWKCWSDASGSFYTFHGS